MRPETVDPGFGGVIKNRSYAHGDFPLHPRMCLTRGRSVGTT